MTSAAREVLDDCRGALTDIINGVQGRQWRRGWIAAIVLLRAVGHVLDNIDGESSPKYRRAVDAWWSKLKSTKPEPRIFWDLIDEERNMILKEYQTRAGQGVTIQLSGIEINLRTGEQKVDPALPAIYHYTINTGTFAGQDQREAITKAIAWWEQELNAIDGAASEA